MHNIVQILSELGASSARDVSAGRIASIAHNRHLHADVERALVDGDVSGLERLIGARSTMRCLVLCPDEIH